MKHTACCLVLVLAVASCAGDSASPKSDLADGVQASCTLKADAGMWDKRNWGKCLEELLGDLDGSGIAMEAMTTRLPGEDGVHGTDDDLFETTVASRAQRNADESDSD